ncbi:GNAT family N-acetyltransferase [Paenibacillus sp. GSMTC-2017]|uniref:GNAT family N-acetyltransferase n=1 Tax=Paenibacillus sp. GSMTC-2017 TaxID=2794350 RepID=UPI0018D7FFCE|nr:GNAT family N-acetyltransferase [Paenibacillus sp. GSMTC-2017]MBH5317253.1 GNAT family N-acetyltransferase [Paenibacillus sp. GSMTC-2017]
MELYSLTPEDWIKERRRLLSFIVRFGEKRITVAALHAIRSLDESWLQADESGYTRATIVIAKRSGHLTGLGFASDGGDGGCLIVVHPSARRTGTGSAIMTSMMNTLGRLACHVAADNIPSMALCFGLGMRAVSIHKGPTGKSTLRFERGIHHDSAHSGHIDVISQ